MNTKKPARTCIQGPTRGAGYCGRTSAPIAPDGATCEGCHAAFRADQRKEKER